MGEISEAAVAKALELARLDGAGKGVGKNDGHYYADVMAAFARYIQAVSDACKDCEGLFAFAANMDILRPFILPEPVDPLTAALKDANENGGGTYADWAKALPEALAKRGLEIREKQS